MLQATLVTLRLYCRRPTSFRSRSRRAPTSKAQRLRRPKATGKGAGPASRFSLTKTPPPPRSSLTRLWWLRRPRSGTRRALRLVPSHNPLEYARGRLAYRWRTLSLRTMARLDIVADDLYKETLLAYARATGRYAPIRCPSTCSGDRGGLHDKTSVQFTAYIPRSARPSTSVSICSCSAPGADVSPPGSSVPAASPPRPPTRPAHSPRCSRPSPSAASAGARSFLNKPCDSGGHDGIQFCTSSR